MKKYLFCFMLILILYMCGCNPTMDQESSPTIDKVFDFNSIQEKYTKGIPGVITDNFINGTPSPVCDQDQAIALAKKECTVQYDSTDALYDPTNKIWEVVFYMREWVGGDQEVYIDSNGITQLIVYGE